MSWTPIADMIEAMFAEGANLTAVLLAVRTLEEYDASRDASRFVTLSTQSKDAVRAARYRRNRKLKQALAEANDAANANSKDVTNGRDASRDGVTDGCDLSFFLSESQSGNREVRKKETTVVVEGQKAKIVSRGTRLSASAALSDEDRKFAADNGVPNPDQLWAEFVDYWIGVPGQRGCKTNWPATWRNRVRAVAGKTGVPNGFGGTRQLQNVGNGNSVIDASDRLIEKLRAFDEPAPSDVRSGEGQASLRLISKG